MDAVAVSSIGTFPPPPYNRMPPDGHEFPPKYREDMPGKVKDDNHKTVPPLPVSDPPRKLDTLPVKGRGAHWRQDERSGKSVRDKIAMFQSVPDGPVCPSGYTKLCKYKSSDDVFYDEEDRSLPQSKLFSRSVVSVDKLGGGFIRKHSLSAVSDASGDYGNRTQSSMDLTSSSSSAYSSSCSPDSSLSSTTSSYIGYSSTLPRKNSKPSDAANDSKATHKTNGVARTSSFNVHSRSQSMLDINPPPFVKSRDEDRHSTLNNLVEQRRKTISKLRGLVIPEKVSEPEISKQPILDLPEIKSRDFLLNMQPMTIEKERRTSTGCMPSYKTTNSDHLITPHWKTQNPNPAIPKYSPAFKRKNISIYGSSNSDLVDRFKAPAPYAPSKPPRSNGFGQRHSFDSSKPPTVDSTSDYINDKHQQRLGMLKSSDFSKSVDYHNKNNILSERCRPEDDSDNDSAVSSSRSSISPPASPLLGNHHGLSSLEVEKSPLARTLSSETTASGASTASTLTSGSHASCSSDSESKRVLKAQSVEAINRKNVLTSAKYSRGFDIKNGSPLIQRKSPERESDSVDGKQSGFILEPLTRKHSCDSTTKDIICYNLAEDYKSCGRTPDVKIAFLNHVEADDEEEIPKKRVEKTESSPVINVINAPLPVPRRVSVPLCNSSWGNEWSSLNSVMTGHSPLTPNMSSESIRSHASSADTIVEKPVILETELVPSRVNCSHAVSNSETDDSFLDVESGAEDSFCHSRTGRSSLGSESVSSGWSFRASDPNESGAESTPPSSARPSHTSVDGDSLLLRKRGSSGNLLDSLEDSQDKRGRGSIDRINARNRRSVSVNDIRKAFEKAENVVAAKIASEKMNGSHARVSSIDSTTSDDSSAPYDSNCNLQREQFGSITSLASSTSLISPQELQSLIDEANLTLEETTPGAPGGVATYSHDVLVVILHRDSVGGSIGITLAGGADYESKEITVHKVLGGSPADRDGRIQKGDRILSINGKSMKGATHRESLAILKSPRPEVVLVVSRLKSEGSEATPTDPLRSTRPPRILEGTLLTDEVIPCGDNIARGPPCALQLIKDGAGLGFSLEGGKDSPLGDKPLVVKKIFTGGAAEKSGLLKAGDEIINVNGVDVSQLSRIEAWKLMKRLPDGKVTVTIKRAVENVVH